MMKVKIEETGRVTMKAALQDFFKGYIDFSGRTTRAGFWWMVLSVAVVELILMAGMAISFSMISPFSKAPSVFTSIFFMAMIVVWLVAIIPMLALTARRLRDAGLSTAGIIIGWMIYVAAFSTIASYDSAVIMFIAILMWLIAFVLTLIPSNTLVTSSQHRLLTSIFRRK